MTIKAKTGNGGTTPESGIVVIAYGPQYIEFLDKANKLCGKGAKVDPDLARMAAGNIACGSQEAMDKLKFLLAEGAQKATADSVGDKPLPAGAVEWLASGNRGISSNTIFTHLTGYDALGTWGPDHPHDPSDFARCEKLLDAVPEFRDRMIEMATCSPVWAELADNWQEIAEMMESEGARCPTSYEYIKECIRVGERKQ